MTQPDTIGEGWQDIAIGDGGLSFEEFAALNGASRQLFGDAGNHRRGERHSDKTWARALAPQRAKDEALYLRRAELRERYAELVRAKAIVPPSHRERMMAIAMGHPDRSDTQAARRIVEKRYGGAGLGDDVASLPNPPGPHSGASEGELA